MEKHGQRKLIRGLAPHPESLKTRPTGHGPTPKCSSLLAGNDQIETFAVLSRGEIVFFDR